MRGIKQKTHRNIQRAIAFLREKKGYSGDELYRLTQDICNDWKDGDDILPRLNKVLHKTDFDMEYEKRRLTK